MKKVFISGISSDIGQYLSKRYIDDGYIVYGTFRTGLSDSFISRIQLMGGKCYKCDFSNKQDVEDLIETCKNDNVIWDLFISSIGDLQPIGKFMEVDFELWEQSIYVNAISQLRLLRGIYQLKGDNPSVLFFAGGGTNNAFPNYSAYCISKIILMKMCELLDDENEKINISIAGPGMIGTKIHRSTLLNKDLAGDNYFKTIKFLEKEGDSYLDNMERIYEFINWFLSNGRNVCGGRNFSIVNDEWDTDSDLVGELIRDKNMYKLRRYKN